MKILFDKANLIHADLSEYNILWHNDLCYFIDVSQSVEPSHENAFYFLYRDCSNIINVSKLISYKTAISDFLFCIVFHEERRKTYFDCWWALQAHRRVGVFRQGSLARFTGIIQNEAPFSGQAWNRIVFFVWKRLGRIFEAELIKWEQYCKWLMVSLSA